MQLMAKVRRGRYVAMALLSKDDRKRNTRPKEAEVAHPNDFLGNASGEENEL